MEFQPNPLVTSQVYKQWSEDTAPRMNVNRGATVWCQTNQILTEGSESLNQRLVGLADPKTLVEPMVSIPIFDTDVWKTNDFMIPNGINDQRRQELYQNGYLIDDENDVSTYACKEGYVHTPRSQKPPTYVSSSNAMRRDTMSADGQRCMASSNLSDQSLYPNNASQSTIWNDPPSSYQDAFLKPFGYFPDQASSADLPTNYLANECEKRPEMAGYNANLFTSTIQPGVYSKSQVVQNDALMSNLGISFTQPFLPTYSSYVSRKGHDEDEPGVMYTQYDPNLAPDVRCDTPDTGVKMEDVYDPRFFGYGTDYRSYVDQLTGRPRFFYDDVDVHRRNEFITRNKLDFEPFGLQTGPQTQPMYSNMEIREMAQNSFLDNALTFRTDLQQRLMQKSNNRAWQQKHKPLVRNQFTRGGSSRASGLAPSGYAGPRG